MTDNYVTKLEESGAMKLYEDETVAAFLAPEAACEGHIIIMPKEKHVILEQLPDHLVAHIFHIANKLSVAAFDALGALGTNIIVQNGTAAGQKESHFTINILPRKDGDKLDFGWKTKQLSEEEMSTVELQLKDACASIGGFQAENAEPILMDEPETRDDSEDLRAQALFRHP